MTPEKPIDITQAEERGFDLALDRLQKRGFSMIKDRNVSQHVGGYAVLNVVEQLRKNKARILNEKT